MGISQLIAACSGQPAGEQGAEREREREGVGHKYVARGALRMLAGKGRWVSTLYT